MFAFWTYFIGHLLFMTWWTWCTPVFCYCCSCSVVYDSLWPHGLQHTRLPCPSPTPGACSNSCPLNWWGHPTISSSVIHFSSCLQFFPASVFSNESDLHIRWPKYWSFSFSISPSNEYSGLISFRMGWFDLLAVQGTLKSLLQQHSSKASILWHSAFFMVQLSHSNMTNGKTIALTIQTFISKVMSLLFNMLCRLVIAFLPRSRCLLISWMQLAPAVILKPKIKEIKSVTVSIVSPSIWHEVKGLDAMILAFWMLSFKPAFSLSFTFIKRLFSPSLLFAIRVLSSSCLRLLIFLRAMLIPACAIDNWYNTFITSLCLAEVNLNMYGTGEYTISKGDVWVLGNMT